MSKKYRILITGACGSIGSGLVKNFLKEGHIVCAFDHSEDGLFKLDQKFGSEYSNKLKLFIGSVRELDRLERAFEGVDIVFHCAAIKHVYLSEYNPFEAMKTNIFSVNNVINAAKKTNVEKVIYTSSDKAVNPTSTMGGSKLLGERLITAANHHIGNGRTRFSSVRFGNVLNTNGSVLHIFKNQLNKKEPLTITSEKMSRFFISMSQALDLCLYASDKMKGGEIFVSNMGSFNIMTLALSVCKAEKLDYKIIGNKPGEKLYEELVTEVESTRTILKDNYYRILPDTMEIMPDSSQNHYKKLLKEFSYINKPIRSDQNLLDENEMSRMLDKIGFSN